MKFLGVVTTAKYRDNCLRCGAAIEKDTGCVYIPRKGIAHLDYFCDTEEIQKSKKRHPAMGDR